MFLLPDRCPQPDQRADRGCRSPGPPIAQNRYPNGGSIPQQDFGAFLSTAEHLPASRTIRRCRERYSRTSAEEHLGAHVIPTTLPGGGGYLQAIEVVMATPGLPSGFCG